VQISRLGERVGVRTIQSTRTALGTDLVGGLAWRANVRWVVGHKTGSAAHSSLATQSTDQPVSLLGLPPWQAAVIVDGQVLTQRTYIAFPFPDALATAMHGVQPAQLHPDDLAAVGSLWDQTGNWSVSDEPRPAQPTSPEAVLYVDEASEPAPVRALNDALQDIITRGRAIEVHLQDDTFTATNVPNTDTHSDGDSR